jgi:hypothetical protein
MRHIADIHIQAITDKGLRTVVSFSYILIIMNNQFFLKTGEHFFREVHYYGSFTGGLSPLLRHSNCCRKKNTKGTEQSRTLYSIELK